MNDINFGIELKENTIADFVTKHQLRDTDLKTIEQHDKTLHDIVANYSLIDAALSKDSNQVVIQRAMGEQDVIILTQQQLSEFENQFDNDTSISRPIKFIPASGMASRMFGTLEKFYNDQSLSVTLCPKIRQCMKGLDTRIKGPHFVFIEALRNCMSTHGFDLNSLIDESISGNSESARTIIRFLLFEEGLNFRQLPKALIPFHERDGKPVLALQEHLQEAFQSGSDIIHLTIMPIHEKLFRDAITSIKTRNPHLKHLRVELLFQKPMTDSIALEPVTKTLVRDQKGAIAFFPSGHGSLLNNISTVSFIRNIDNIPAASHAQQAIDRYHKAMIIIKNDIKVIIKRFIDGFKKDLIGQQDIDLCLTQLRTYKVDIFLDWKQYSVAIFKHQVSMLMEALNRPLCIIGVVKNEGEPGGGPFFYNLGSVLTSSIIEKDEISKEQESLMKTGMFFNPVDILVDPTDVYGEVFGDLAAYQDSDRYFLVRKLFNGREIARIELPGLWNGRMAKFNKVWINLPLMTFAPVKEITDLLNDNHQQK